MTPLFTNQICNNVQFIGCRSRSVGDPNDPNNRMFFMVLTGVTVIGLLAFYQGQYREITWKDFVTNYLTRGVVS